jgi:hypothetical protein
MTQPDLTRPQSKWRTIEWQAYAEQQAAKAVELEKRIQTTQAVELVAVNTKLSRTSRDRLRAIATRDNTTLRAVIQQAVDDYLDTVQE